MSISRRTLLTTLAAAPAVSLLPRAAFAAYPDHPVRVIVPFAAGGNADLVARLAGDGMSRALSQPFIIESRAGAGGSLGAAFVAAQPADGYMILTGSNGPLTVNPFFQAKLGYDPLKDFVAIGLANLAPHGLAVHESVPAKTLQELIELSKKQSITIGTSGVGSASHMTLVRFNAATGAKLVHVPYRGGGALGPDMLAGNISGVISEMSTVLPHYKGGKIRILGIAALKRSQLAPDVPTMIEGGVKDFTAASYVGFVASSKTSPDVISTLEKALIKTLAEKPVQDKFISTGAELVPEDLQTSKGFGDFIKKDYADMRAAAQAAGIKPE